MKVFNTTGPCDPELHHLVPPLERFPRAMELVRGRTYLAVSGPRQSGKTSLLKAIVDGINAEGWGRAVLVSCEPAGQRQNVTDVGEAERRLVKEWHDVLLETFPEVPWPDPTSLTTVAGVGFSGALRAWTVASDRPLVVVIDEVDTLARQPFLGLLSQIRSGFERRGRLFPTSVVLAGMRNLRDQDVALGGDGGGSPFNVVEFVTEFWKLHRDMMKDRIRYPEAVAHFGLMTYLHRVVNGGGRVEREFAVGRGRLDLLLVHGDLKLPIEVKVHRDRGEDPVPSGLQQLDAYCAGLGVDRGWLVVFDQRTGVTTRRLEDEEVTTEGGRRILVVRA